MIYECNKCYKKFNRKCNYISHINRKFTCNKNLDIEINNNQEYKKSNIIINDEYSNNKILYKCDKCNKEFNKKSNYLNHINKKKTCENDNLLELNKYLNLEIKYNNLENKIIELEKENNKINILYNNLLDKCINNNIINNTTITNNTINVTLTNFGLEDYNKLTKEEQLKILKSNKQSIPNLIKFLHINDRLPEYKNICIKNLRGKGGYLYENNKWFHCNFENLLMILFKKNINDLDKILSNNEELKDNNIENIKKLIDNYTDDMDTFIKDNKDNIINMLYNNTKNYKI
jgi:hypothetical protein